MTVEGWAYDVTAWQLSLYKKPAPADCSFCLGPLNLKPKSYDENVRFSGSMEDDEQVQMNFSDQSEKMEIVL